MTNYYVASGVTSTGLILTSDSLFVTSGGTAINTTLSGNSSNETNGFLAVEYGGSADRTTVNPYGQLNISGGGIVTRIKENGGCVNVGSGATATFVSNVISGTVAWETTVHSGTTAYQMTVPKEGKLYILEGGLASGTVVDSSGKVTIASGGTTVDTTLSSGGRVLISSGGRMNGVTVLASGSVSILPGGSMQNVVVSSGGSLHVSSGATATNVTLSGGRLIAASGATVEGFVNKKGSVYAPEGATIISKGKASSSSKLEVSSDCDSGWNNYLYAKKKTPPLNTSVYSMTAQSVTSKTKGVLLDKSGAVSHEGKSNYVGYGDEADFTKIKLTCGARLVFNMEATGAAKFTIWSLTVSGYDKKGDPKYKMKALQTVTLKNGQSEADTLKKAPLLAKGDYYISVEAVKPNKGGSAYYNVSLNSNSVFYSKGDNFDDDWGDFYQDSYHGVAHLGTVDGTKETLIENGWVGFGDAVDFRKFTLKTGAKLSLAIYSSDATKISICRVDGKPGKEPGLTFYTLKTLQTTTVKKQKKTDDYFSLTKPLLLDKGDYFIRVESTNAKKGGNAEYSINLVDVGSETVFFDKGNNSDDWDDMKTKGASGKVLTFGEIKAKTTSILDDEWVGFGDEIDYRKFTIKSDAKLSFELYSTDTVKFTVYKLDSKTDKKGVTTYSLKALHTTTVKANERKPTKLLSLDADTYYFSMASTNAKKGGNATYDIALNSFVANPKSAKNMCALAMPETDLAPGFAETCAGSVCTLAMPEAVSVYDESVQDRLSGESGGLLANL